MTLYTRGVLMAVITTVLFGVTSSVAKLISVDGLSQMSVMVYRTFFVVVVLTAWFSCTGRKDLFRVPNPMVSQYAMLGFFSLVCNATGFMMSCMYLSVPQAVIIHYTFPLSTMVASCLVTREPPTRLEVIAGVLVAVGLCVGFSESLENMEVPSVAGVVWGVVSVLGFSGQVIVSRSMAADGKSHPLTQLFYTNLFGGVMILVGKSLFVGWADLSGLSWPVFAIMQYPAIAGSLIAFGLLFAALRHIPPTTASLICSLEIVVALAAMPLFLGTLPSVLETLGASIIFVAVTGSTLLKGRAMRVPPPKAG